MADEGVKLSALDSAGTLNGTETLFVERAGLPLKTTPNNIADLNNTTIGSAMSAEAQARNAAIEQAISDLKDGVIPAYDTLNKLAGTLQGLNSVVQGLASGSTIPSITANDLTFFDTFFADGFYENNGVLGGTYIALNYPPILKQRVDTADKIYIRTINLLDPLHPVIPAFTIYGTYQPAPVIPDTTGIRLIPESPTYTVTVNSPENIGISAGADGTSVVFPSLGGTSKSITFLLAFDSNSITFNGTLIPAGETVFAVWASGEWTINSTVVTIPVIPNYSDISVNHKVDTSVDLEILAGGNFRTYDATILTFAKDDKILLAGQFLGSQRGVYQIQVLFNYAILNLIASASVLDIVRVEGDGAYESTYDGMFPDAISFVKITASNPEIYIGPDQPDNTFKLWIDTSVDIDDVIYLRQIKTDNLGNSYLSMIFDESKEPHANWWYNDDYSGALWGDSTRLSSFASQNNLILPDNLLSNKVYILGFNFANINVLDLGDMTEIIWLSLSQNNLTSIDITKLTKLQKFSCNINHISEIDITGLSQINDFGAQFNDLTADSIAYIFSNFVSFNTQNGSITISDGTSAYYSTWSDQAKADYVTLISRGWTIVFNNDVIPS